MQPAIIIVRMQVIAIRMVNMKLQMVVMMPRKKVNNAN
jgi:hypothetical protein